VTAPTVRALEQLSRAERCISRHPAIRNSGTNRA
jgi:hypothetical protein